MRLIEGPIGRDIPAELRAIFDNGLGYAIGRLLTGDDKGVRIPTECQRPSTMLAVERKGNLRLNARRRIVRPRRTRGLPQADCGFAPYGQLFLRHLFLGRDVEHQIASSHQVGVFDTGSFNHLTVEGHLLEMRPLALQSTTQRLAVVKLQCPARYQWRMKQVVALARIRIEAQHVKGEPRRHRPTIVIAWQTIGPVAIVLRDNLPHAV